TRTTQVVPIGRSLAARASDPRDAADRAAFWTLVSSRESDDTTRISVAVGIASGRDDSPRAPPVHAPVDGLRSAIDRAIVAWNEPVLEARSAVEPGQGELWILIASPCGTEAEAESDAGLSAALALATASRLQEPDAFAEPLVTSDAVGLFVHGP